MRAFLFPHRILATKSAYKAALHYDNAAARAACDVWINQLNVEQISFFEHKLIGMIFTRFGDDLAGHPARNVIQNITRQGRLRAHANLDTLRKTLLFSGMEMLEMTAVGEVRERHLSPEGQPGDCDVLELSVDPSQWNRALDTLVMAGWSPRIAPRLARARGVMAMTLAYPSTATSLRLLGLQIPKNDIKPIGNTGLYLMTNSAHIRFMRSRLSSLLRRRDQFLFDICRARQSAQTGETSRPIDIKDLPLGLWSVGKQVLGVVA